MISKKIKIYALFFSLIFIASSCLTSKKMDRFVAKQYDNQLPPEVKAKQPGITIKSLVESPSAEISTTVTKTSNMLPLIFYWQWDYKNTCALNPQILVNNFGRLINTQYSKELLQRLNGQQLVLTIEQMPQVFAFDDKSHLIWLIYAFGWDKITLQPQTQDLIVSYETSQNGQVNKSGKITIKNNEQTRGLRFFQSWKSCVSEYIDEYNSDIITMTKDFIKELNKEL